MKTMENLTIRGGGQGNLCQTALRCLTFKERGSRSQGPDNVMKPITLKPQIKQRERKLWVESRVSEFHIAKVEPVNM